MQRIVSDVWSRTLAARFAYLVQVAAVLLQTILMLLKYLSVSSYAPV